MSQVQATCPLDRKEFTAIHVLEHRGGAPLKKIPVERVEGNISEEAREQFMQYIAELNRGCEELMENQEELQGKMEELVQEQEALNQEREEFKLKTEEITIRKKEHDERKLKISQIEDPCERQKEMENLDQEMQDLFTDYEEEEVKLENLNLRLKELTELGKSNSRKVDICTRRLQQFEEQMTLANSMLN